MYKLLIKYMFSIDISFDIRFNINFYAYMISNNMYDELTN